MTIGLIDLDTGNLASLKSAMIKLNIKFKVCKKKFDFEKIDKIIMPGVGAFKDLYKRVIDTGIDKILLEKVEKKQSILGICVGFQVLFSSSSEHGYSKGLNILDGSFQNFSEIKKEIPIPHVGWNECVYNKKNNLFYDIKNKSDYYFTHSYFLNNCNENYIISKTKYHLDFVSAINYENIYGVQFHPEKSQLNGLKIIKNFCERC